ncbi:malate dehydrogenase, partial [bacterium]|nr:malate dehydrogenase [bacterium]
LEGADMFVGLSVANIVTPEMIKRMRKAPVIFAMANPDPEIKFDLAKQACPDAMIGTGRSDFPNQVNNVLGFPFIFRGALDVRASAINDQMKIAASNALSALAKEPVPASVLKAYGLTHLEFGPDYIVPKPLDNRVCLWEAPAVAKAAMESGVSRIKIDLEKYERQLKDRLKIE